MRISCGFTRLLLVTSRPTDTNHITAFMTEPKPSGSKEEEVLSMFFDEGFTPSEYVDAVFSSELRKNGTRMQDKSLHFADVSSLQGLQTKCSSLLTHFDYYTNELTRRFEDKIKELENTSSIISYRPVSGEDSTVGGPEAGITRLEYYVDNLTSSLISTQMDLASAAHKATEISQGQSFAQTESSVGELKQMIEIKRRIYKVVEVFDTVRSLISSGEDGKEAKQAENNDGRDDNNGVFETAMTGSNPSGGHKDDELDLNENDPDLHFSADTFASALSLLKELILEQISSERRLVQNEERKMKGPKKEFVVVIDGMIRLEPFFGSMVRFNLQYKDFVGFLKTEKTRYLKIFA